MTRKQRMLKDAARKRELSAGFERFKKFVAYQAEKNPESLYANKDYMRVQFNDVYEGESVDTAAYWEMAATKTAEFLKTGVWEIYKLILLEDCGTNDIEKMGSIVVQKEKAYSPEYFAIRAGDRIYLLEDDQRGHLSIIDESVINKVIDELRSEADRLEDFKLKHRVV